MIRELRLMLSEESLLEAFLWTWQELMRHDEVILAGRFLACAPWRIRHRREVRAASEATARAAAHLQDDATFFAYYASRAITTISPLGPGEVPSNTSQYARWRFVRDAVASETGRRSRALRILDLGSQDGWMSIRLAEMGHAVVGVEMMAGLIALSKLQPYPDEARNRVQYVCASVPPPDGAIPPTPFDVYLCCELWEHVRDDESLYEWLVRATAGSDAIVVLTTPEGSWFRGLVPVGLPQTWDGPREHVRAATLRELVDRFGADFTVERAETIPSSVPDVVGQAHACLVARRRA